MIITAENAVYEGLLINNTISFFSAISADSAVNMYIELW